MLRIEGAERAEKMCQDEWLNESVIPSANENAAVCVTKRSRGTHPNYETPAGTTVGSARR